MTNLSKSLRNLAEAFDGDQCAYGKVYGQTSKMALEFEATLADELRSIHGDLANARLNGNLPSQINNVGIRLQQVQQRIERLVTSLGGGVFTGQDWLKYHDGPPPTDDAPQVGHLRKDPGFEPKP